MKYTFKTEYKLSLILTPIVIIFGIIALSLGKNVSGCLPLWSWTIAVVIIDCLSFCVTKHGGALKITNLPNRYAQIIIYIMLTRFPIIVLFIMGLITVAEKQCREKWRECNPLLLDFSIIRGALFLIIAFMTVFFHECWDVEETPASQPASQLTSTT